MKMKYRIIIITIEKIIKSLKSLLSIREENNSSFFFLKKYETEFPSYEKKDFEALITNENKMIKRDGNTIKYNQIKKRKDNINDIDKAKKNKIIIFFIIFIKMNIYCTIKSNILFDLFHFQYSSTITLKIKGIGERYILGNQDGRNFMGINYLKEVKINGITKDTIKYKYDFEQEDNEVELIWDDNLNSCECMFWKCSDITEINLTNFDTSKITSMKRFFSYCSSLISLDLSKFDTSQVTDMECMFCECVLLTSLDLSNFNTSKVTTTLQMFDNCENIEVINLNNFDESNLNNANYMFFKLPSNAVVCVKDITIQSKIISALDNKKKCYAIDCTDDFESKQNKLNNNDNQCNEKCDISSKIPYEYNGKCYVTCEQGYLYDENNNKINKCKCELDECLLCPTEALKNGLCTKCNTDYYQKYNDPFNIGNFMKCYKTPEGYYLDDNLYKQCYYTCKTCDTSGNDINHNCIECNINFPTEIKHNNYVNCYTNCNNNYYFDDEFNYHCTPDSSCPNNYPKLNENTKECTKYDIQQIINDFKETGRNKKKSKKAEIEFYDDLIKKIEKEFTENYDVSKLDNGNDEVINTERMKVIFTTPQNQKNNINKNITIDLETCENLLRNYYKITNTETIYMKITEVFQEGYKIPKVEYDVYSKLFGTNLIKLNLTVCENSTMIISIPIELVENPDKLNSSSGYYNDICYTTTSEDDTDITLKDRKTDFIEQNKTVCQEDCKFSKYDNEEKKVKCSCKVKESSLSFADMNINKEKLTYINNY